MRNINLTKKDDLIILVDQDNVGIETYSKTETVDFSKLMGYLLKLELIDKVKLIVDPSVEYDENEKIILSLLDKITSEYNNKVDEFSNFVKENIKTEKNETNFNRNI